MSWTLITKAEAANFCGVSESTLRDAWSDWIEQLILKMYSKQITTATYTEKYDGTGTDTLYLDKVPITSVTSVKLKEPLWESSPYSLATIYVYTDRISLSSGVFPEGTQNVEVVYVAGVGSVDARLGMAEAIALSYLLKYMQGNHGDSGLKWAVAPETGANQFSPKPGVVPKIRQAIQDIIPIRARLR